MQQKFYKTPFAEKGDRASIAENSTSDGTVSYQDGWGIDYQRDMDTDQKAKAVERDVMNGVLHDVTENISHYQKETFPEWITPADNAGQPYHYKKGTVVKYDDKLYISVIDNNDSTPSYNEEKWQTFIYERATKDEAVAGVDDSKVITPETLEARINNLQNSIDAYLLPVGFIGAWVSKEPPIGWLECNGDAFDKNLYPKLAKILPRGFLPDFRGQFVRGWDHGRGIDLNRDILSQQGDAIRNITGEIFGGSIEEGCRASGAFQITQSYKGGPGKYADLGFRFDASLVVPTADENRPKNIAVMYIIKTDLAQNEPGDIPTNIIVSPSTINKKVGDQIQLNVNVLPNLVSPNYPVSFTSSDNSVCTVDSNGLVTLVGNGKASVVAFVSTGLYANIEVTSNIILTSIQMNNLPEMQAGDSHQLIYDTFPINFTEPLLFNSSNCSVASISNSGEISAFSEGNCTISVTGAISGVTASKNLKVKAIQIFETYLQIENNLEDLENVITARNNLGLGNLAIKDSLNANDVGALPIIGNFLDDRINLNDVTDNGIHNQNISSNATFANNYPIEEAGSLIVIKNGVDATSCRQTYLPYSSTLEFRRYGFGNPIVWSTWDER